MAEELDRIFLEFSITKLNQLTSRIQDCLGRLSRDQVWMRGGGNENAIGNLVLHLCGNVRQWIVSGVGGKPDVRVRAHEFSARSGIEANELAGCLQAAVGEAVSVLKGLTAEQLKSRVQPQGYSVTVLEAVYHVVEHFAQHTGQIIFATKAITGADLGYYSYLEETASHSEQAP